MDQKMFPDMLKESRVIYKLGDNRPRVLFLDNCSGNTMTDEAQVATVETNTKVAYFPSIATHIIRPHDSFVVQNIM